MRGLDLKSLGVGLDEVKTALARERRKWVRKRLVAISTVLAGSSIKEAARAAKATRGSVERWLKQVRQAGHPTLLLDRRRRYPRREMTSSQIEATRCEIAAAFERPLKPQVRSRLSAIDMVLSGQPIDDAAAFAVVKSNTVKDWLRVVTYDGIVRALARWEGRGPAQQRPWQLDADPVALRELAAKERNPRIRKRMLALACVAERMSPHAAGLCTGMAHKAVAARIGRFKKEGIAAFQDRQPFGRPTKLTAAQLRQLRTQILERPELTYGQLHTLISVRFRVRYSPTGLARLLRTGLGIVRRARRFCPADAKRATTLTTTKEVL